MSKCKCGTEILTDGQFCHKCGKLYVCDEPERIFFTGYCPQCDGYLTTKVRQTPRPWRWIECKSCGYVFETMEIIVGPRFLKRAENMLIFLQQRLDLLK
jgi:hypothetical protein